MNISESKAYNWLLKKGYQSSRITIRDTRQGSPDFTTDDGKGWEAKHMKGNVIVMYTPSQVEDLLGHQVSVLAFDDASDEPVIFPLDGLKGRPDHVGNLRIRYYELPKRLNLDEISGQYSMLEAIGKEHNFEDIGTTLSFLAFLYINVKEAGALNRFATITGGGFRFNGGVGVGGNPLPWLSKK